MASECAVRRAPRRSRKRRRDAGHCIVAIVQFLGSTGTLQSSVEATRVATLGQQLQQDNRKRSVRPIREDHERVVRATKDL